MATTIATSTTLATTTTILTWEICELEELRVTNSILATARNRLANDNSQKVVKLLIDKLQKSYSDMLDSVERCKIVVSKSDRLWALFHKFSVDEGTSELCTESM